MSIQSIQTYFNVLNISEDAKHTKNCFKKNFYDIEDMLSMLSF